MNTMQFLKPLCGSLLLVLAATSFTEVKPGYTVFPHKPKPTIRGHGVGIQSDLIG
jgi:hypothetical protein